MVTMAMFKRKDQGSRFPQLEIPTIVGHRAIGHSHQYLLSTPLHVWRCQKPSAYLVGSSGTGMAQVFWTSSIRAWICSRDERFGKWRLFPFFDIWNLAFYKRPPGWQELISPGCEGEERGTRMRCLRGGLIQWWFIKLFPPGSIASLLGHSDLERGYHHTSIERKNAAVYFVRIAHIESRAADLFITGEPVPLHG